MKLEQLHNHNSPNKSFNHPITNFSTKSFISSLFNSIVLHANPLGLHICYFLTITVLGYLALKLSKPRTDYTPTDFDLFFTAASASTVASLSTVEMEVFSNTQLVIMFTLIFLGGEIFISLLGLQLRRSKLISSSLHKNRANSSIADQEQSIELGSVMFQKPVESDHDDETRLLHNSIKSLGYVVTGYILVAHVLGTSLVSMYISLTTNAKSVLENKGLVLLTFYVFTTVSTFANCGFIPTNENMIVFRNNPGLLLILIPFGLVGETLYPPCLRLIIWVMERYTKRKEYTYMLENYKELNYGHLMSSKECWFLVATVFGFLTLQFVTFCIMEWSSGVMEGMSSYEKVVGSLFQMANARHAGESVVDLSVVSSVILVIFIVMMYFPPYTSFLPIGYQQQEEDIQSIKSRKMYKKKNIIQNLIFSQLSYLTIFVILICFTERKSLKDDPLNFNVLNIVFEVISAYGSVGFSTGYGCKRRLKLDENCIDKSYGLAGWFSKEGKAILILAMFYGRFKKFNVHGGQAWRLI
ncbi:sodium transporter HKT1 [Silene latifolia]|uniref:sodium transporter HKT1 n=1 Tax=Silene latifolia TaxID=37657 RepID=UPI003D778399